MTLEEYTENYYLNENFNCAETLLHACNTKYRLGLSEDIMKMMGGFGGGMFIGSSCGALVGCNAALSKMMIKNKAHEELDIIRPAVLRLHHHFRHEAGGHTCVEIKPRLHSTETRCLQTCLCAARAMEKTVEELQAEGKIL